MSDPTQEIVEAIINVLLDRLAQERRIAENWRGTLDVTCEQLGDAVEAHRAFMDDLRHALGLLDDASETQCLAAAKSAVEDVRTWEREWDASCEHHNRVVAERDAARADSDGFEALYEAEHKLAGEYKQCLDAVADALGCEGTVEVLVASIRGLEAERDAAHDVGVAMQRERDEANKQLASIQRQADAMLEHTEKERLRLCQSNRDIAKDRDEWKERANVLCESCLKAEREAQPLAWRPMPSELIEGPCAIAFWRGGAPACHAYQNDYHPGGTEFGYIQLPPLPTEPVREATAPMQQPDEDHGCWLPTEPVREVGT